MGGIVLWDDYRKFFPGVKPAVDELVGPDKLLKFEGGIDSANLGRISGLFGVANPILAVHGKYFEIRENMFSMETAA
jgi:hypothetical protein